MNDVEAVFLGFGLSIGVDDLPGNNAVELKFIIGLNEVQLGKLLDKLDDICLAELVLKFYGCKGVAIGQQHIELSLVEHFHLFVHLVVSDAANDGMLGGNGIP